MTPPIPSTGAMIFLKKSALCFSLEFLAQFSGGKYHPLPSSHKLPESPQKSIHRASFLHSSLKLSQLPCFIAMLARRIVWGPQSVSALLLTCSKTTLNGDSCCQSPRITWRQQVFLQLLRRVGHRQRIHHLIWHKNLDYHFEKRKGVFSLKNVCHRDTVGQQLTRHIVANSFGIFDVAFCGPDLAPEPTTV